MVIKLKDEVFYKALIDNYGATETENKLELTMTSQQINNLKDFTYLGDGSDKIRDISGIENFKSLESININKNEVGNLSLVTNLTNLESLEVQSNNLAQLPNLSALNKLKVLDITGNKIENLEGIKNNISLRKLIAPKNSITNIAPISGLTEIEELNLEENNINNISAIGELKQLKILNLSKNFSISRIEVITELNQLTELYLDYNNYIEDLNKIVEVIEEGQEEKAKLFNLKKLNLAGVNNEMYETIDISDLDVLKNLEVLDLSSNNLTTMDGVIDLKNLKYLNLDNNEIEDLTPLVAGEYEYENGKYILVEFEEASKIEELRMNNNKIEFIDILSYLSDTLKYLDLGNNHIHSIMSIEKLKLSKDNLILNHQTANFALKKKENINVEQKVILENIIQMCKVPTSKIYATGIDFVVTGDAKLNNDSYKINNQNSESYNKPGYYNIVFPADAMDGAQAKITIKGGCADGSEYTYTLTESWGANIFDTIVFEDYNLFDKVKVELSKQEISYASIPYIINLQYEDLENVETLNLSGEDGNKIRNVKGLESFINLKNLNLSINEISSNDSESKIKMLMVLPNIEILNLSSNRLKNAEIIENYKYITAIYLSNNTLNDLAIFENWFDKITASDEECALKTLHLSNTGIYDLTPIKNITTLINLDISKNSIKDIKPIENDSGLVTLNISDNEVEDISILRNLTKLNSLSMGTNKIKDISSISNLNLRELDISNNKIESLEALKNKTSLVILKASKNRINTIEPINNLNGIKNDNTELNDQKIFYGIEASTSGIIEIDLPKLFLEAKQSNSLIFTSKDFKCNNCEITQEGKVKVNVSELGNKVATVKIDGGKAHGSQFAIGKAINATVAYNIETLTNQDVIATVSFSGDVKIVNNDGKNTYKFTENGEFNFEYENDYGLTGEIEAKVNWIDKKAPVITGVEDGKTYQEEVTPIITDENLETLELTKNAIKLDNYESGTPITEEGNYVITATDGAGNITVIKFTIKITGEENLNIELKDGYKEVEDGEIYVININPETKIKDFEENIETNGEIRIFDSNSIITDKNTVVKTGMKMEISKENESIEFILVIKGDSNGDGQANFADILKINKHRLNKAKLQGAYLKAGDVNQDKKADFTDILKINKFRLNKINEL